jgi:hypothetical protein
MGMREIAIVVATRGRVEKLLRFLRSIDGCSLAPMRVLVAADGDPATIRATNDIEFRIFAGRTELETYLVSPRRGSVACRNFLCEKTTDAILYATDDMEFRPGAIEAASRALVERFYDEDGVVGFHQEGVTNYHPSGVALVGGPFVARYPARHLFFPGYFHFSAQEVGAAASHVGRFYLCREAVLYHHHPDWHRGERDKTHEEGRERKVADQALSKKRKAAGLIWGISRG